MGILATMPETLRPDKRKPFSIWKVRFGHIVVSEIEVPNLLANLVQSG
jgi:hypothetical protein